MIRVLVTYASRAGSTAEIATVIADVLRDAGLTVTLSPCAEVDAIDDFDAVVIGSGLYVQHWMREAVQFIERTAPVLGQVPTWLFQSGPCGPGAESEEVDPPHRLTHLTRRWGLHPAVTFGGRLDTAHATGPVSRWVADSSLAGDYRDWSKIREWASSIARDIVGASSSDRSTGISPELAAAIPTDAVQ